MMQRFKLALMCFLIVGLVACSKPAKEGSETEASPSAAQAPAAPEQPEAPAVSPPAPAETPQPASAPPRQAARPAPTRTAPPPPPPAPADPVTRAAVPEPERPSSAPVTAVRTPPTAFAPPGTTIEIRLSEALSSATEKSGDTFEGSLSQDLEHDGRVLAPRGTKVLGKLSNVNASGRVEGRATMAMTLTELHLGETSYPIRTNILSFEAESAKGRDVKTVGGSTGVGALIGAIAGGKKGAAIGAAIGAGAGTATVLVTKGKEVEFEPEQKLRFRLEQDLEVKIR